MFVPIGDTPQPPRGFVPWVNWLLLSLNAAIFVLATVPLTFARPDPADPYLQILLERLAASAPPGTALEPSAWDVFVEHWGFVPGRASAATLLSAMFLHANLAHVAGNLLFLWIYGDNVEHRLGRLPYLATYLGTGAVATLAFASLGADPAVPLVGASGAISGVLGCYFVMFPKNQVRLFVGLFPFLIDVWLIPAPLVIGFFVVVDNLLPFFLGSGGGVAYGAHLGGFAAGLAVAGVAEWLLRRSDRGDTHGDEVSGDSGPADAARAHLRAGDRLAARGQTPAAFQHYLAALRSTDDPAVIAHARRGLEALPLHPRLRARLGLSP
jgi:membrane associated rhomboid family serine protease